MPVTTDGHFFLRLTK